MQPLPKWAFTNKMPAFFEADSRTALESVAILHGAVNQLIEEYNNFAEALQREVENLEGTNSAEIENFKKTVEQRLTCKFKDLDAKIQEAKTELTKFAISWLEENQPDALPVVTPADDGKIMMVSGGVWAPVVPALSYDTETETLNLNILGGE